MGEVRESPAGSVLGFLGPLERLPDPQMQLRPTRAAEPVVQSAPDEFMREAVGEPRAERLFDHAAAHGLLQTIEQLLLRQARGAAQHVELELGPCGRGQLEDVARRRRDS